MQNPQEKNFSVEINFNIKEGGKPYASPSVPYEDMSYDTMQMVQSVLIGTLLKMGEARMSPEGQQQLVDFMGAMKNTQPPAKMRS